MNNLCTPIRRCFAVYLGGLICTQQGKAVWGWEKAPHLPERILRWRGRHTSKTLDGIREMPLASISLNPAFASACKVKHPHFKDGVAWTVKVCGLLETVIAWQKKQQTIYIWTDSAKKNCTGAFTVLQTVQKNNNNNLHMDRQCKKKTALEHLQCSRQCKKTTTTIYIWTDSAKKKLHWSIYSAPDSAKKQQQQFTYGQTVQKKNCTGAFTVLQTVQKNNNNNNLHMDRQCKKKLHWSIYSAPDSAKKQQQQFTYGQTVQKNNNNNLHMDRQCKKTTNNLHMDRQCKKTTNNLHMDRQCKKTTNNLHMDSTYLQTVQKTMCKIHIHILSTHSVI